MIETLFFLGGCAVGFGLGMFGACMLAFSKNQDDELEGDEYDHF